MLPVLGSSIASQLAKLLSCAVLSWPLTLAAIRPLPGCGNRLSTDKWGSHMDGCSCR